MLNLLLTLIKSTCIRYRLSTSGANSSRLCTVTISDGQVMVDVHLACSYRERSANPCCNISRNMPRMSKIPVYTNLHSGMV